MSLLRVRRAAQLALPADVRQALNVQEGDYLQAKICDGGVLLTPVSVVERKRAWMRIEKNVSGIVDTDAGKATDNLAEEEGIAAEVAAFRRERNHA
jgi:antitoxin component of MazEF toxin-antitoxin module